MDFRREPMQSHTQWSWYAWKGMYFHPINLKRFSRMVFFERSVDSTGLLSRGSKQIFPDITHSGFDFLSDH